MSDIRNFKVSSLVKESCTFQYCRNNTLWYQTDISGFTFPVPTSELGDAAAHNVEKGIHLMRWIKRYKDEIEKEATL